MYVFIGGLHRSGTTFLARVLATHPQVTGFADTPAAAKEDEGQHLQAVYPTDEHVGGPGNFARHPQAHLTEADALDPGDIRRRLLAAWEPYWDPSRPVRVEKSPPNLLRFRYLQAAFPEAAFIQVLRHPIAVSKATQRWSMNTDLPLLEHWVRAHEIAAGDRPHLSRLITVRYEQLVGDLPQVMARVCEELGLPAQCQTQGLRSGLDDKYFQAWQSGRLRRWRHAPELLSLSRRVRPFGYSMRAPYYRD